MSEKRIKSLDEMLVNIVQGARDKEGIILELSDKVAKLSDDIPKALRRRLIIGFWLGFLSCWLVDVLVRFLF